LPRSAVVEHRNGLTWHAIPIDAASIGAIQRLRRQPDEPFNDTLRAMLDLPPVGLSSPDERNVTATRPKTAKQRDTSAVLRAGRRWHDPLEIDPREVAVA
jgi:hypothetical protein